MYVLAPSLASCEQSSKCYRYCNEAGFLVMALSLIWAGKCHAAGGYSTSCVVLTRFPDLPTAIQQLSSCYKPPKWVTDNVFWGFLVVKNWNDMRHYNLRIRNTTMSIWHTVCSSAFSNSSRMYTKKWLMNLIRPPETR